MQSLYSSDTLSLTPGGSPSTKQSLNPSGNELFWML